MSNSLIVLRTVYTDHSTRGILLHDGLVFCVTLEDAVREPGAPKVYGKTAIPAGRYEAIVSWSERFNKPLPELLVVPDFTNIRMHGGNRPEDSEGCILVGSQAAADDQIYGSMAESVTKLIESIIGVYEKCFVEIINAWPWRGVAV